MTRILRASKILAMRRRELLISAMVLFMLALTPVYLCTQPAFSQSTNNTVKSLMDEGVSLYKEGNYSQAIPYYNEILSIDPNNTEAIYNKGLALDVLGKYEDAITHYNKVLEVFPNSTGALVNTGGALADLGNYAESINYFDKTLSIDPNNTIAIENKKSALSLMSGDR
jgi:tetratricopeptide (TPR) repeat protein